jgi:hypothetical protein
MQWVPEVKWPRREADHSPSSAEVKNFEAIPPLPHIFMAQHLIKEAEEQIYLYLLPLWADCLNCLFLS